MSCLFCHASPHLILFGAASVAEKQIRHYDEEHNHKYLYYREVSHYAEQIRLAVVDISLLAVQVIHLDRSILFAHDVKLSRHVVAIFHRERVEVAVTDDFVFRIVENDDRSPHCVVGDIVDEKREETFEHRTQLGINERLVVIEK